jgi:lipoprotein-releasing system permease protein
MNLEYYIAKRIHFQPEKKNVSRPAVRIAIIGIAIGLAVMLVSVAVILGFKTEISNKTIGFGGHIQITNLDANNTFEMQAIQMSDTLMRQIAAVEGVKHIQRFATKPGIIKTDTDFQGVIIKGVSGDFDWDFFESNLVEGRLPEYDPDSLRNEIIVSKMIADLLQLHLGDRIYTYFIQEQVRARRFEIIGIYSTNFADYDKMFLLADMRHIQHLNNWDENTFGGLEALITDFDDIDRVGEEVYRLTANKFREDGGAYHTLTVKQLNPQIFSWLDLLDMNVWVILILLLVVAGFNMISGLLILILERINMIGILKSLGASNWFLRKIFLYHSIFMALKGMFWGNLIGLSLCAVQYFTHIIPLDPSSYYVSTVPIEFHLPYFIALNAGTFLASILMMIGPSYLITKISPAKIIRYE